MNFRVTSEVLYRNRRDFAWICWIAWDNGFNYFFQNLEESSCLGPTGTSIMTEWKGQNDSLYTNVGIAWGCEAIALILHIMEWRKECGGSGGDLWVVNPIQ